MLKRIWTWIKKIPILGWIVAGAGFLLGILWRALRRRPSPVPGVPSRSHAEIEAARDRVVQRLEDDRSATDQEYDDYEAESRAKWAKLRKRR